MLGVTGPQKPKAELTGDRQAIEDRIRLQRRQPVENASVGVRSAVSAMRGDTVRSGAARLVVRLVCALRCCDRRPPGGLDGTGRGGGVFGRCLPMLVVVTALGHHGNTVPARRHASLTAQNRHLAKGVIRLI